MKEYTTAEVIKVLFDNPKLIAEAINEHGDKYHLFINFNGYLYFKRWNPNGEYLDPRKHSGGHFNGNIDGKLKWHLVPQPVPWQEALQARLDGKTIKVDCPNCGGDADSCVFEPTQDKESVCFSALKGGSFYVIEAPID